MEGDTKQLKKDVDIFETARKDQIYKKSSVKRKVVTTVIGEL